MAKRSEIVGLKELEKTIKRLGKLPQKCVTKAARKGANIGLKAARQNAPVDEGNLKKALVLKGEKSKIKGKKVYQITFDPKMNYVLVKESKAGKRSYYPASQEYGFQTVNGGYIPGYRYLRHAAEDNKTAIEKETVKVLTDEIDKIK
ncbi:HK97-gp10 family putative phage morphogenesis protein [Bacillus sp. B-jedd]|uniref:HK97-gp10 family putative phage morphogenesis protein n=1 Tax=Bacillus sp. B-jedd TaxID=1476857 RepID=UPI0005156621|nr:HK97-gp10 family putative phage morphogenesis protein [Bacillus sp. B-jedd]CEG26009.1 hypothetical protein BN1002_00847 [Bacillus sp. B-jedd]